MNIKKLKNLSTGCEPIELNCSSAMARHLWATNVKRKDQRHLILNVKALSRTTCLVSIEHDEDYVDMTGCAQVVIVGIVMLVAVTIWAI